MADNPERMNQQPNLRLIVCPHPLSTTRGRIDVPIPAGATVAEHLRTIGCELDRISAMVYIDDRLVPKVEWETTVPQAGQSLAIQAVPASGDDRGSGKSILAIGAFLGLMMANQFSRSGQSSFPGQYFGILPDVVSRMVSGGNVARMMLSGGLIVSPLGGLLAVMALIPTPAGASRMRAQSSSNRSARQQTPERCFRSLSCRAITQVAIISEC